MKKRPPIDGKPHIWFDTVHGGQCAWVRWVRWTPQNRVDAAHSWLRDRRDRLIQTKTPA